MDPIQQILAQGQMGDKNGGLQQYYFEGKKLAQQDQQINLQRQRLQLEEHQQAKEDALLPYRIRAAELNNQKTGIDIMKGRAEAETSINTLHGDLLMTQMLARRTDDGTLGTPAAMSEANAIIQKTPYAGLGKSYQQFAQQWQIAQSSAKLASQFGEPTSAIVTDKETGTSVQYGNKSNPTPDIQEVQQISKWRELGKASNNPAISEQYFTMADNLEAKYKSKSEDTHAKDAATLKTLEAAVENAPTPEAKASATRDLQNFTNIALPPGSSISLTGPDGYKVDVNTGRPAPGTGKASAEEQKLREQTLGLTDTAKQIQTSLLPNLENIYGPKATLGNFVVDKSFANLNPDLAVGQRIAGREAARYLYQGVLRQLNHNQRVNAQQEKDLKNAFPALEGLAGMHESPADAKVILQQLQKQLARDSYVKQRLLGDKAGVDTETLQFLDPKFLVDEVKAGRLSEETAISAMQKSPFQDEIKALANQK